MLSTSRLSLPYPEASDPPDGPTQIAGLATALDVAAMYEQGVRGSLPTGTAKPNGYWYADTATGGSVWVNVGTGGSRVYREIQTTPTVVSSAAAFAALTAWDGREVAYVVDSSKGWVWRFRYRSAAGSAYKWEFVGGPEAESVVTADEAHTVDSAWNVLATGGPSITLPLAGDYDFTLTADMYNTATNGTCIADVGFNGADPGATTLATAIRHVEPVGASNGPATVSKTKRNTSSRAAGDVVAMHYWGNGLAGAAHFANRVLRIKPVRVG